MGSGTAIAVVRLTGIRTQIAEGDTSDQQRIIAELFVAFRRERKHALTAPPCHRWPRPAVSVTVDNDRRAQRHDCHTLKGHNIRSANSRVFVVKKRSRPITKVYVNKLVI